MPSTTTDDALRPMDDSSEPRSARLLRDMHKVFSHDLPNQMVALQSLLQLLSLEESSKLSNDGREYVRRLQNAARLASEQVRFLKDMGRVNTFVCRSEPIVLATLARELQGELKRQHPDAEFAFEWQWHAPALVGDSRVYLQAIAELCAGLMSEASKPCRLKARSEGRGDAIALTFHLESLAATRSAPRRVGVEPMEIVLARAWLALEGATVEVNCESPTEASFVIVTPKR